MNELTLEDSNMRSSTYIVSGCLGATSAELHDGNTGHILHKSLKYLVSSSLRKKFGFSVFQFDVDQ